MPSPAPAALRAAVPAARLAADLIRLEQHAGALEDYAEALDRHAVPTGDDALGFRETLHFCGTLRPRDTLGFRDAVRLSDWARRLRRVFATEDSGTRCLAVDALLAAAPVRVRLDSGPTGAIWRFETVSSGGAAEAAGSGGAGVVDLVMARTAGALAVLVVAGQGDRLGLCALPWCREPFVAAATRGRPRRYCSRRCGNQADARRHRERALGLD